MAAAEPLSKPGVGPHRQFQEETEVFYVGFLDRYDERRLSDFSGFALYIAHKALDLVEWEFDGPVQLEVLFEDRAPANAVKSFTDLFKPLEVHVYQWPER